jgi:putative endonuclease
MRARQALGRYGEDLAAAWLHEAGMAVLARNWRCRTGEIDIVARDGDVLVVCEVKTRRGLGFGSPLEAVTTVKAHRLARLAVEYRRAESLVPCPVRIDVVGVLIGPDGCVSVEHVRGTA